MLLTLFFSKEARATHAMGADLTYECIGPNQYRVRLSFYRDCAGVSPGGTQTLNYRSTTCGQNSNVTLNLLSGYPIEVSPLCPSQRANSRCNGGTLPGIQQWIYEAIVTLPMACTDWIFSCTINARNNAINTILTPGSMNIYVEARMNNVVAPCNNSPVFSNLPVPYVCLGQPLTYNHGATDSEGDSLFYELVPCLHTATVPVTYVFPYTATSPFASSTPIRIDSANGTVTATPSALQVGVFAVRVNQYRGGVLIGSVLRDIQITVITCTNTNPVLTTYQNVSGGTLINPTQIAVCAGSPLSFRIIGSDMNTTDSLSLFTNITAALPGATFTIRGRNPDTLIVNWTPTIASLGFRSFTVNLFDNACPIYGQTVRAYDIFVSGINVTTGDTLYRCFNGTTPSIIRAAGSTTGYTWSVVSGDSTSLTCTTCNPISVSPNATTIYRVTGTVPLGCKSSDTVIVVYVPAFAVNTISDTTICLGASVNLSSTITPLPISTTTYNWTPATGLSSTSVSSPIASPTISTRYIVQAAFNICSVYDTVTVNISGVLPIPAPTIVPTPYCKNDTVTLNSNVNPLACNVYNVTTIPYAPLATTGSNVSLNNESLSSSLNIGFPFNFFCNSYSNFFISSNGFITFTSGSPTAPTSQVVPNTTTPNNLIALYWEDLNPSSGAGNINYFTTGITPNRKLVVNFNNVRHSGNNNAVTGQIILYETTNVIELHYNSAITDGGNHTMGIENSTGTSGFSTTGRNSTSWSINNAAFRFAPSTYIYTWTPTLGLFPRTDTSYTNHIVNGNSTYNLTINNAGCISNTSFIIVDRTNYDTINRTICSNQFYLFNGINRNTNGRYIDTLVNSSGCDSIITLNLTVIPTRTGSLNATICSNQTYLFNGVDRNTNGSYLDTLTAANGCDSVVTLTLVVIPISTRSFSATICSGQTYLFNGVNRNTAGTYLDTFTNYIGCDSVVTLNLIVNPTSTGTINATICSNQTYLFNGVNRNTAGTYLDTFTNFRGCDSIVTLNLIVNSTSARIINVTICSNQTYLFNGVNRNTAGTYLDTFNNSRGCDSFVTLNLIVNPISTGTINATICSNQTYLFNGVNRNTTGTYLDTFNNYRSCDSVVTLNLIVNPISTGTINATICSNQAYLFNGVNRNTAGVYLDTFINFRSCDSVVTLNLIVNPISTGTINATICSNQTYLFNGINRNTAGTYLDTFTNFRGCDSIVTLNLIVNSSSARIINVTICSNQTYLFNGVNRNTAGVYLDTFNNYRSCDSVVTLNLIVNPTSTGTINATICSNQTYLFNGVNRNTTGTYLDTFNNYRSCDSVVTLNLIVNPTSTGAINATICSNQAYLFNGVNRNTAGTYLDTFNNYRGCDSVVTLNLIVNPISTGTINATICSNQTYLFNGVNRNTAGTYLDTFNNYRGCDSVVTLNLIVNLTSARIINVTICSNQTYLFNGVNRNTAGVYLDTFNNYRGCDSVVTLNLIVNPTSTGTINATICSNQTYLFNGVNRNTTGTYLDTFNNYRSCDSVVTLNLIVNPISTGTINATICSNQAYLFNGVNRNTAGVYLDTFINFRSCDSVVTLNLIVNPISTGTINATICSNQTYLFNGINRNTAGTYLDTFTNFRGCDSIVTLNLIVNSTSARIINVTICSNQTYLFNGVNRNTAGVYLDTFNNYRSCDSFVTLNLIVNPISTGTINATICSNQTYLFNGVNRNTTGTYLDTFNNYRSCDSVVTLNLIVNPTSTGTINATICSNQTFLFNGVNRNTAGTYLDTFNNYRGCDSVVTLNLIVNPTSTGTINATICSNQTYLFNGENLNAAGSYTDTFINSNGCDSLVTLNLTVRPTSSSIINETICNNQAYLFNGENLNTAGTYIDTFINSNGCDSVVTLNLIIHPTTTGSDVVTICTGQTYLFNGEVLNATGIYFDTIVNSFGCDSFLTLYLNVSEIITAYQTISVCSPNTVHVGSHTYSISGIYNDTSSTSAGCDSVIVTTVEIIPTSTGTINATICSNQAYLFNGVNRNTAGTYLDTFTNYIGCDSVVTLNLIVNPTSTGTINATICSNQTYLFNGENLNAAGSYTDTFINSNGCDSLVTLNLTVRPTSSSIINETICNNQAYLFNGENLNTAGTYIDTFINSNGCDSVVTLNLIIHPTTTGSDVVTICTGQTYLFNGEVLNATGIYFDTIVNSFGCDSFLTLYLNVSEIITAYQTISVCSPNTVHVGSHTYSISGIYNDTSSTSAGCDSVIVTTVEIIPTSTGTINATICSNQAYLFNGVNRNTAGTYLDTFTNYIGCDSVVTLNLIVNPTSTGTINATICSNQTYLFNGENLNAAGSYTDTFINSNGCDSLVTLNLTVRPTSSSIINETICNNQTYLFNGENLNTAGTYIDTFINSNGCDSVVTLNLIIHPTTTGSDVVTICTGQTYLFNGEVLNATGIYFDTIVNSFGCDSFLTLYLNVSEIITAYQTISVCSPNTVHVGSHTYSISGIYNDTSSTSAGCDSVIVTTVEIIPTSTGTINATICSNQAYLFNGVNRNTAGTYLDTFTNYIGCDSVVTLNLIVNPTSTGTINATICSNQTYLFNGENLNAAGSYTDTFINSNGCDSLVTLNLTVRPTSSSIINAIICSNQTYLFNGENLNIAGSYIDTFISSNGCDSVVTLNLTIHPTTSGSFTINRCTGQTYLFNGEVLNATGIYFDTIVNSFGCDSFLTLYLNVSEIITAYQTISVCSPNTVHVGSHTYSISGIYNDTSSTNAGCDSVIVTTVEIIPTSTGTINATICSNQAYLFNGINRNTAGTYLDTFNNYRGCDSVVTLNLIVNPTSTGTINATICSNQTYLFNGENLNAAGSYTDTFINSNGCDSLVTLNLTVRPTSSSIINAIICSNQTYLFNGENLNIAGSYIDTFINSNGCDSVVTLNLTIHPTTSGSFTINRCTGQTYLFNGEVLNVTGVYRDTITNIFGCDSFLTLNLNITTIIEASQTISVCSPNTVHVGSHIYSISGIYNDTSSTSAGCDSVIVTTVEIIPISTVSINVTICSDQSYLFNGVIRNTTGSYLDTFINYRGCDSVVTLHLTVNPTSISTINATICSDQTYLFNGININATGSYLDTFINYSGCDSVVTLNLNVRPTSTAIINATICSNHTYLFNGVNLNTTGLYIDTFISSNGCDSVVTLNLIVNPISSGSYSLNICTGQTYLFNGILLSATGLYRDTISNSFGCDSFLTLNLIVSSIIEVTQNIVNCSPSSITVGIHTYTVTGVYRDTSRTLGGCDSVTITNLTIYPRVFRTLQPTICANEVFIVGSHTYNTAGMYNDTFTSYLGCDSIISTNLFVLPISIDTFNITICSNENYLFGTRIYTTSGTYIDTFDADNGCDSIVILNLNVLPISTQNIQVDICSNEFYFAGNALRNISGIYFDTLISNNGCDSILRTDLVVHSQVSIVQSITICRGGYIRVGESAYTTSGTYFDTLITIWGCDSAVTTNLTVNPVNHKIIDTTICFGDRILIGSNIYTATGTYYDTLNNIFGCDSTITTILNVLPVNIRVVDTSICEGHYYNGVRYYNDSTYNDTLLYYITHCDSFVTIHNIRVILNDSLYFLGDTIICIGDTTMLMAIGGDNLNYYWWPNIDISCTNCAAPIFTSLVSRVYYCMSFGPCGDTLIASVNIIVNPLPIVTAYGDTSIIYTYGAPIYAQATGAGSINYDWYSLNGMHCSNCQYTTVYLDRSQPFIAVVQDENGCINKDSIYIKVKYDCSDSLIEVPNMMTPNGDGANDVFRFKNPENIPISTTRVFNRWGEMMFESASPSATWDGTYQGMPVNTGVYVYVIEGGCPFNRFIKSGNISIIK